MILFRGREGFLYRTRGREDERREDEGREDECREDGGWEDGGPTLGRSNCRHGNVSNGIPILGRTK